MNLLPESFIIVYTHSIYTVHIRTYIQYIYIVFIYGFGARFKLFVYNWGNIFSFSTMLAFFLFNLMHKLYA